MTVTKSKGGLFYLAIGVLACLSFASIGAANTQSAGFGMLMACAALVFYVAIFEIAALIKATTKTAVIVAGGLGLIVCFSAIGVVSRAVITGNVNLVTPGWWILPLAVVFWTAREVYNRKRPTAPI